ncbi:MAG: glycosyltransferase [Azospirillaceae bacterium]
MKILHVIPSLGVQNGGPPKACLEMARAMRDRGHEVAIFTGWAGDANDRGRPEDIPVPETLPGTVTHEGMEISFFPNTRLPVWAWMPEMSRALRARVAEFDVVHIHSLYLHTTKAAADACQRAGVPYIIRPHGSLDPYLINRSRGRKRVMEWLYQNRAFRRAAAVHFTAEEERRLATPYVHGARGVVAPLGVDLSAFDTLPAPGRFRNRYPELADKRLMLFFGRLHFKKGLDLLVGAFARLAADAPDLHLVIAGPDDGYGEEVRGWIAERGLSDRVLFTGMLTGEDKRAVLVDSDVFVLPSYTENFGMAILEALCCRLPVVISDQVNIHDEVAAAEAGLVVPCDAGRVAEATARVLADPDLAARLVANGLELVANRYDWRAASANLEHLYGLAIEAGDRPNGRPGAERAASGRHTRTAASAG